MFYLRRIAAALETRNVLTAGQNKILLGQLQVASERAKIEARQLQLVEEGRREAKEYQEQARALHDELQPLLAALTAPRAETHVSPALPPAEQPKRLVGGIEIGGPLPQSTTLPAIENT